MVLEPWTDSYGVGTANAGRPGLGVPLTPAPRELRAVLQV
jgi:hypothetical protein